MTQKAPLTHEATTTHTVGVALRSAVNGAKSVAGRVNAVTSRMTMYRLVLTSLGVLAAVSLMWSVLGFIAYRPVAVIVSWAVPLAVSYVSNRVLASIYRVVPHSESSLITGYLIFFIFPPTTDLLAVSGIAVAAVFASASKYVLAYRGRHVFNPAAAGVFAVTLFDVYFSGWWVGTPALLPFSVAAALLILHRTRRFPMAAAFIVVSGTIMFIRSLSAGLPVVTAALWPLTSSPIVFFAGFMLSEPLTQPPLRWQQLTVAGVVGVLFSVPMHLGAVYAAPESALLVGNAIAFVFGQRKGIELVLHRKTALTPTTFEFSFTPTRKLHFRAGQYVELTVPHKRADDRGLRRVFSISSAPGGDDPITIGTKMPTKASSFKRALAALPPGSAVTATLIAGDFVLPRDLTTPVLLVAGGIGITPFASQLAGDPAPSDVVLLYSVSGPQEISYRNLLEKAGVQVVIISPTPVVDLPARWTWVNGTRIDEEVLRATVSDINTRQVYISGPPAMVSGLAATAHRLHAGGVHTDIFNGY